MDDQEYAREIGARILSEANDLKRNAESLAKEIGFNQAEVETVMNGEGPVSRGQEILRRMAESYPISLSDIWVDKDDTNEGVVICRSEESEASSRVIERKNKAGELAPYYEYRDTAMSRRGPYKPEWIREIQVVEDDDPENPNVAYNNGHLLHQLTFFIGPVNFYFEENGQKQCHEMDTGSSCYITPFIPHSFTSRDRDQLALIIAVTYGGQLRKGISEFSGMPQSFVNAHAGDRRDQSVAVATIKRFMAAESLDEGGFERALSVAGVPADVCETIVQTGVVPDVHREDIASVLNVRPGDLPGDHVSGFSGLSILGANAVAPRAYPYTNDPSYMWSLARSPQDPQLKSFRILVLKDAEPAALTQGLLRVCFQLWRPTRYPDVGARKRRAFGVRRLRLCPPRHHPQLC